MTEVVCMTWVVCAMWVCTHLGLLTSVSRGDSVVSLLVHPSFCLYWVFLSNEEEGVVLSCSVSVMGMSFFLRFRSLLRVRRSVYGGGSFFVFCPVCGL